jgi:hypothetical protein
VSDHSLIGSGVASVRKKLPFSSRANPKAILGLELGSDISAALDIDEYYVLDRNPDQIIDMFADVLYRQLKTEAGEEFFKQVGIVSAATLVKACFSSAEAFQELVRAAEGVIRDLINVFQIAANDSFRKKRPRIDVSSVREAASQWYNQDKAGEIDEDLRAVLQNLISNVIGEKKSRSFLGLRELEKNDMVQRLFDSRVLHLVKRGYADKENPGVAITYTALIMEPTLT